MQKRTYVEAVILLGVLLMGFFYISGLSFQTIGEGDFSDLDASYFAEDLQFSPGDDFVPNCRGYYKYPSSDGLCCNYPEEDIDDPTQCLEDVKCVSSSHFEVKGDAKVGDIQECSKEQKGQKRLVTYTIRTRSVAPDYEEGSTCEVSVGECYNRWQGIYQEIYTCRTLFTDRPNDYFWTISSQQCSKALNGNNDPLDFILCPGGCGFTPTRLWEGPGGDSGECLWLPGEEIEFDEILVGEHSREDRGWCRPQGGGDIG